MRHVRFARLQAAIIILALATVLAGCSIGDDKEDAIHIGIGIDASYAPLFLAAEEGMFKDAGLDVELVQFGQGGEAIQAIAGQQVQLAASSDTTVLTLMAQNPALRALYIYEESGRYLKVVARPGIKGPGDIKKMGVAAGLSEYMARKYFESNDIALSDVEFIEAGPPELPTLTKKGDVDAYLLWEPWPSKGVEVGLKELTDTGSYGYSYVHWMVSDQDWLKGNEKDAAKVADVLAEAAEIVAKDPARAAAAVHAQTKIPKKEAQQAIELVDWKVRGFTDADLDSYGQQIDYFLDKGTLEEKLDVKPLVLSDWYEKNKAS